MLGAAVVLGIFVGSIGFGIYSLRDDALAVVEDLPQATRQLRRSLRQLRGEKTSAIATVTKAATELEKAAAEGVVPDPAPPGVTRVQIEEKAFDSRVSVGGSMASFFVEPAVRPLPLLLLPFSGDLYRAS